MLYDGQINFIKSQNKQLMSPRYVFVFEEWSWYEFVAKGGEKKFFFMRKNGERKIVNVLLESDQRCPPTSVNDYPDSRRERDDEAAQAAVPPKAKNPDLCPPRRGHGSNTRITEEEEQETSAANAADRTRNSADDPQGRRPNPRTTPQLLATKVPSSCTRKRERIILFALKFSRPVLSLRPDRLIPRDQRMLACLSHVWVFTYIIWSICCFPNSFLVVITQLYTYIFKSDSTLQETLTMFRWELMESNYPRNELYYKVIFHATSENVQKCVTSIYMSLNAWRKVACN